MKNKIVYIGIAVISIFFSCSDKSYKTITGNWTIDEIVYENSDVKLDLLVNMIEFNKNGECYLPTTLNQKKQDRRGSWVLNKNSTKSFLIIQSSNEIFNGQHLVSFEKDHETQLLKLIIKSNKLFLRGSKLLHNFDSM